MPFIIGGVMLLPALHPPWGIKLILVMPVPITMCTQCHPVGVPAAPPAFVLGEAVATI